MTYELPRSRAFGGEALLFLSLALVFWTVCARSNTPRGRPAQQLSAKAFYAAAEQDVVVIAAHTAHLKKYLKKYEEHV
jgi:hypothetical protein